MKALLLDRQALFRRSLSELLQRTGQYAGVLEARSTAEFVRLATSGADIAVVMAYPPSISLSAADCLCLVDRLIPGARTVIFRDSPAEGDAALTDVTYVDRAADGEEILAALKAVQPKSNAGNLPIRRAPGLARSNGASPTALCHAGASRDGTDSGVSGPCADLSRRQRQIMAMVAEGLANKEIAARLGIAEGTVKAHIHAVFKALGVTNRTQAVVRYGGALRQAG